MRKWTVMVLPQGGATTHTIKVYAIVLWSAAGILMGFSFLFGFFLERYQAVRGDFERLEQENSELRAASLPGVGGERGSVDERGAIEEKVRAEYEARYEIIEGELGELYDLEGQVRAIHGLPPRSTPYIGLGGGPVDGEGGKGGQLVNLSEELQGKGDDLSRPPSIIYGLSGPSADLIVEEINLRTTSLRALVGDMEQKRDGIERTPSIWPSAAPDRWISSSFGYRKDPFTRQMRHHSGTDVVAPYGSPVVATAKGVVGFSGYDRYLGNLVKIDHGDGMQTWYGHLQKSLVKKGDPVERGEVIGKVGDTGRSTGAHIHYEVHMNGKAVNSAKYLGS